MQQSRRVKALANSHLADGFSTQWRDATLAARDPMARKSEAVVAAVGAILTCLDTPKPRLALNAQFPGMTPINKFMSMEMMTLDTVRTTMNRTLATVVTRWKNQHTQWVLRQMTPPVSCHHFLSIFAQRIVDSQFLSSHQFSNFVNTSNLGISKCFLLHYKFFL